MYHFLVLLRSRTWIGFSQCDNRIIIIILLLSGKQWYFNIGLILLWPPSTTHHPASQPGKPTQREIEKDAIGMITLICRIRCPALLHSAAFSNYMYVDHSASGRTAVVSVPSFRSSLLTFAKQTPYSETISFCCCDMVNLVDLLIHESDKAMKERRTTSAGSHLHLHHRRFTPIIR